MVARLRHYLSTSVLKRFADKIDTINLQLTKNGNKEQVTLEIFKKLIFTKSY